MFAVIISLLLGWVMWYILTTYTRLRKMPPGPFPLPLIGNVHQVGSDPPFSMEKLREKYGEVYTLTFPIGTYVVVNSGALAREVLVTAKDDFASRPGASTFPSDDVFKGKNIVYSDFGPNYMFRRKIVTSALHTFGEGLNLHGRSARQQRSPRALGSNRAHGRTAILRSRTTVSDHDQRDRRVAFLEQIRYR